MLSQHRPARQAQLISPPTTRLALCLLALPATCVMHRSYTPTAAYRMLMSPEPAEQADGAGDGGLVGRPLGPHSSLRFSVPVGLKPTA